MTDGCAKHILTGCLLICCALLGAPDAAHAQGDDEDDEGWTSKISPTFITHARSYSLFGASLARDAQGDLDAADLALSIQRVRPTLDVWWSDWLGLEAGWDVIPLIGASQNIGSFAVQNVGLNALRLIDFDPTLYESESAGLAAIQNLQDGSLLLIPNVAYDFAENVAVSAGGILPLGARPEAPPVPMSSMQPALPQPQSEFGLFPLLVFTDIRLTF